MTEDYENATVCSLLVAHKLGFKVVTADGKELNPLLDELERGDDDG